ncbi:hypothetical protein MXD81_31310 [Microbacteriaceae bacterium K1510]|nr:hypothetical protein [Microbacteriaceae bacterium K1510]
MDKGPALQAGIFWFVAEGNSPSQLAALSWGPDVNRDLNERIITLEDESANANLIV